MTVRKIVAGSVLAAGLGVAGVFGAGTASAIGASLDLNGDGTSFDVGSGASTTQSGNASGNPALAVSLLGPSATSASGNAKGNTLIAIDGLSSVSGNAEGNTVATAFGASSVSGNSKGNTVANFGSAVGVAGNTSSQFVAAGCGTKFSGQGTIAVNPVPGGLC